MKLKEVLKFLTVGSVLEFADGEKILIGDASLSRQPTDNDGGIGWDESYLEKDLVKFRSVRWEQVLDKEWYETQ